MSFGYRYLCLSVDLLHSVSDAAAKSVKQARSGIALSLSFPFWISQRASVKQPLSPSVGLLESLAMIRMRRSSSG
jgi:hypothetical protein